MLKYSTRFFPALEPLAQESYPGGEERIGIGLGCRETARP
jgi:hypothetical protein